MTLGRPVVRSIVVFLVLAAVLILPREGGTSGASSTDLGADAGIIQMVVDGAHHHVFLSDARTNVVWVADYTGTIVAKIPITAPMGLALSGDGSSMFVATNGTAITIIDTASLTIRSTLPAPSNVCPSYLAAAANRLWMSGGCSSTSPNPLYSIDPQNPASGFVDSGYRMPTTARLASSSASATMLAAATDGMNPAYLALLSVSGTSLREVSSVPQYPTIFEIGFTADGSSLLVNWSDDPSVTYGASRFAVPDLSRPATTYPTDAYPVASSPTADGRYMVVARSELSGPSTIDYFPTNQPTAPPTGPSSGYVLHGLLAVSPDGSRVFTVEENPYPSNESLHVYSGPEPASAPTTATTSPPATATTLSPPPKSPPLTTATTVSPAPAASSVSPTNPSSGYWLLGADGSVIAFGDAPMFGSAPIPAGTTAVHIERAPSGAGYLVTDNVGHVYAFGAVTYEGGAPSLSPGEHIVTIAATPDGHGYWLFTNVGRVLAYGTAPAIGDMAGRHLNGAIIAAAATPSGHGYFLIGTDGGVFTFGDARFAGSMGGEHLNAPIVAVAPSAAGNGYRLIAADGGVFCFGAAPFYGSMGGHPLNKPVVGAINATVGYLLVAKDGGIFDFSNQPFVGSLGATPNAPPIMSAARP